METKLPKTEEIRYWEEEKLLTPEQLAEQEKIEESYYIEFDSYDSLGVARSYGPCINCVVVTALVLRLSVFVIVILNIGEGWKKERKQ